MTTVTERSIVPVQAARPARGQDQRAAWARYLSLGLLVIATLVLSLGSGAVSIAPRAVFDILSDALGFAATREPDVQQTAVLLVVRLPRVLFGMLAGATLAMAGAAMQGLFRNPLADPALLGVSSGASVGAAAMILGAGLLPGTAANVQPLLVPLAAFSGALLATLFVLELARLGQRTTPALLLTGVAVNAIGGAATGLLTYLANDAQLRSIAFWQMGSFGSVTWGAAPAVALLLCCLVGLPFAAKHLNILQLGEAEAGHLGLRVTRLQRIIVVLVALGVGASVAVSGIVGFVGLAVPHLARLLVGPDHRQLLPVSALLGAALLGLADLAARRVLAPSELPIGILTAAVGAPLLLVLIRRSLRGEAQ